MRRPHRDRNHGPIVEALKRVGCRVADLSGAGDGVSDLLVYRPANRMLLPLEVKNPETVSRTHRKEMRKKSKTELAQEEFRRLFPMTKVVMSVEEALQAMGIDVDPVRHGG